MRFILKLTLIALCFSCSTIEKKVPDLLSCIPQNTLAVLQLNDQKMISNALSGLLFIEKILALDPLMYSQTLNLFPDKFPNEALICFTPEGKSGMGVTFLYNTKPQDSIRLPEGELFEYDKVKVAVTKCETLPGVPAKAVTWIIEH